MINATAGVEKLRRKCDLEILCFLKTSRLPGGLNNFTSTEVSLHFRHFHLFFIETL